MRHNGGPRQTLANMPQVPPMYVRDVVSSPGSVGYNRGLANTAASEAHGKAQAEQYGLDWIRRKKVVKPFSYTTTVNPVPIAAAGQATAIVQTNKEACFVLHKIMAVVTKDGVTAGRADDFLFRIRDDRKQLYLSNAPLHNLAATGSGVFPLVLPQPKMFKPASTISIEMTNRNAGEAINVFWQFEGKNYYFREYENITATPDFAALSKQEQFFFLAEQKKYIEPYIYTLDDTSVTLTAGGTLTDQLVSIRQQGDFEIFAWTAFSDAPFTWIARESTTGRFLFSGALASTDSFGDGERPHLLPESYWLDSNSQILITLVNLDPDNANEVFLHFIGRCWYDTPSMNLVAGPDFYYDKYRSIE